MRLASELSWAEEEDGPTRQGPPHSSWNLGEARQYFLSAKGLQKPSLHLPCDQRQKSRNSLKPTVCFSTYRENYLKIEEVQHLKKKKVQHLKIEKVQEKQIFY